MVDAKNFYLEGKSSQGLAIMNSFVPELTDLKNWIDLKNKLNEAETFLAWAGDFDLMDLPQAEVNEKLDQVLKYLNRPIPLLYWQKSNVPQKIADYYQVTYKKLIQTDTHQTQMFVGNLQRFLRVELLIQKLPDEIKPHINITKRAAGR